VAPSPGVDVVVVGAGVVGLAAASALARSGRSVLVMERHGGVAREVTSRNSQVIHAGIYSPPGSLKSTLCIRGRELLYPWLKGRGVAHRKVGKLIVAVDESEMVRIAGLLDRGLANGVSGLALLGAQELRDREPRVVGSGALYSPESGIVDASGFALSLLADAETHGATLLLHHEVVSLEPCAWGWRLGARVMGGIGGMGGEDTQFVDCEAVVNAAGLGADGLAERAGMDLDARGYRLHPCKGSYFALAGAAGLKLRHLVYPAPPAVSGPGGGGLGIHATLDLAGGIRFGPDAEYVVDGDLAVDPGKARSFAQAVGRYLPGVRPAWLLPDFAGLRPKLAGPGEGFRDFVVKEESEFGFPGLINCIGIESPGLTAALAIAERVVGQVVGQGAG
jgi:L-2-hydroxyglutarate oxidase LhgO